jgi:hypothetical protein
MTYIFQAYLNDVRNLSIQCKFTSLRSDFSVYFKILLNSIITFPNLSYLLTYRASKRVNVYIPHYKLKGDDANAYEG